MTFFGVLGLIFIVLKLCGVIMWSWWLVLLPLYGFATLWFLVFILLIVAGALFGYKKKAPFGSFRRK